MSTVLILTLPRRDPRVSVVDHCFRDEWELRLAGPVSDPKILVCVHRGRSLRERGSPAVGATRLSGSAHAGAALTAAVPETSSARGQLGIIMMISARTATIMMHARRPVLLLITIAVGATCALPRDRVDPCDGNPCPKTSSCET